MVEINLTQTEADALIATSKVPGDDEAYDYPGLGGSICVPLVSEDKRESFLLDVRRGRIKLRKCTHKNRARKIVVLVRLDLEGPPHVNPDGEWINGSHLHIYREGYGDKWAQPVPAECFTNLADTWRTLEEFMDFCHVVERPHISRGLFP